MGAAHEKRAGSSDRQEEERELRPKPAQLSQRGYGRRGSCRTWNFAETSSHQGKTYSNAMPVGVRKLEPCGSVAALSYSITGSM